MALMIFSVFGCSFDPSQSSFNDTLDAKGIRTIQDQYTELAWRYLLHRYDHQQAVHCFSNPIRVLCPLHQSFTSVEDNGHYQMVDSLVQQTESLMMT